MTWAYAAADNQATLEAKFLGSSRLDSERCFLSWGLSRGFLFFSPKELNLEKDALL